MVTKGEKILLVSGEIGLTETTASVNSDSVVYDDGLARGPSNVTSGGDVVMVKDGVGQGSGGAYPLNEERLKASDTLVPVGTTVTLSINVVNSTDSDVSDYTMEFKENGTTFDVQTANIPAGEEHEYSTTVTKNNVGQFEYQANDSNKVSVAWLNVDPGPLKASDNGVALHQNEETTTLSITVDNPSSQDRTVRVDFREDDTEFHEETATISANGGSHTFSVDRTYTSVQEHSYDAFLVETGPGIGALSNEVGVRWYDEATAWDNVIVPVTFEADESDPNTTEISANASKTDAGFLADPEGEDGVIWVKWEDSGLDNLPRDCSVRWYNSSWEDGGYVRVQIWHRGGVDPHHVWLGDDKFHFLGEHQISGEGDDEFDTLVHDVRCYNDGTITDTSGNELGNWK